jgi:hypothetical protein
MDSLYDALNRVFDRQVQKDAETVDRIVKPAMATIPAKLLMDLTDAASLVCGQRSAINIDRLHEATQAILRWQGGARG